MTMLGYTAKKRLWTFKDPEINSDRKGDLVNVRRFRVRLYADKADVFLARVDAAKEYKRVKKQQLLIEAFVAIEMQKHYNPPRPPPTVMRTIISKISSANFNARKLSKSKLEDLIHSFILHYKLS